VFVIARKKECLDLPPAALGPSRVSMRGQRPLKNDTGGKTSKTWLPGEEVGYELNSDERSHWRVDGWSCIAAVRGD
jgi:hypothetical protein